MNNKLKKTFIFLFILVILIMVSMIFLKIKVIRTPKIYTQQKVIKNDYYSKYDDFFTKTSSFSYIPGLKEGAIPQGICYAPKYNLFIVSQYHRGGAPSVLQLIDYNTGELIKSIILNDENNKPFNGHVGGITTDGENIWVTDNYTLLTYSLNNVINSNNMDSVVAKDKLSLEVKADFITYDNDILWIGEYVRKPFYHANSKLKDDLNIDALLIGFDTKNELTPTLAFSLPNKVQGLAFDNDNLYLSESFWFLENSYIKLYNSVFDSPKINDIKINNTTIPLLDLKNRNSSEIVIAPPMIEGICLVNNNLYMVFESAANYYKYYTYYKLDSIYKLHLD